MSNKFYLALIMFFLVCISAWGTHVFHCFNDEKWFFLIAGAIAAPVGVLHGIYLWFV